MSSREENAGKDHPYTLLHVRSSHYVSTVASGVIVTGPTDDGFVHLHFFRESQRILGEEVPIQHKDPVNLQLDRAKAKMTVNLQREEVATISLPERVFGEIVKGLMQVQQARTTP